MDTRTRAALNYDWQFWARPTQLPPEGSWLTWVIKAGRGFGKSRAGAEWIRGRVETGVGQRLALIARTPADVRDVLIEGESGLLAVCPPWNRPTYEPSKRKLTWPNGAFALAFSSYEPDQLRGPQFDSAWCDELATWKYARETFDNLQLTLRLGTDPRQIVTTTPRPLQVLRDLLASPTTVVTGGSTYENRVNLAETFFDQIVNRYAGTTLGRQEIYAELLSEIPGALWTRAALDALRVFAIPPLLRIVVAIDPAVTSGEDSDEAGIIVAGLAEDGQGYLLEDVSLRASPDVWARRAVGAFHHRHADRIVAEVNNGGDMVEYVLRTIDPLIPYRKLHASRGKQTRAEPVAALYEQGKIHHVGTFPILEDQLCQWVPGEGDSPDRLDALVWAFTELMLHSSQPLEIRALGERQQETQRVSLVRG